jgi:hypothetical protein
MMSAYNALATLYPKEMRVSDVTPKVGRCTVHSVQVVVSACSVNSETLKSAVTELPVGLIRTTRASLISVELVRAWLLGLGSSTCERK